MEIKKKLTGSVFCRYCQDDFPVSSLIHNEDDTCSCPNCGGEDFYYIEEFDIRATIYELYKRDWVRANVSRIEEVAVMRIYCAEIKRSVRSGNDICAVLKKIPFDVWIEEVGYNGGIYTDFETFQESVYLDKEYITTLLEGEVCLLEEYHLDIQQIKEEQKKAEKEKEETSDVCDINILKYFSLKELGLLADSVNFLVNSAGHGLAGKREIEAKVVKSYSDILGKINVVLSELNK